MKIKRFRILFPVLSIIVVSASLAQTVRDMEKQKQAADKEIKETKAQLGANEKKVNESLSALRKIEDDITNSKKEIETVQGQLATINGNISKLEGSITVEENELKGLREEYLKAVKKMRVARKRNSDLAFLFASNSFNEARRRMRYMKEFSEWKDRRSGEIKEKVASLEVQKKQLSQARNDANVALQREKAAQNKLAKQKDTHQATVAELRANSETLKEKLAKRQAEARKLSSQISALIAEEQAKAAREEAAKKKAAEEKRRAEEKALAEKKAAEEKQRKEQLAKAEADKQKAETKKEPSEAAKPKKENKETVKKQEPQAAKEEYAEARKRKPRGSDSNTNASGNTVKPAEKKVESPSETVSGFAGMKGKLPKPVNGAFKIVSAFGVHPISPDLPDIMDENLGIDAHVANGAAACAVYDGDVIKVYDRTNTPGFRNIVVVKHGDYITVYANLETLSVHTGQKVKQGQTLGTVGSDFDDSAHGMIHFEIWKNQTHLDPGAWIRI